MKREETKATIQSHMTAHNSP